MTNELLAHWLRRELVGMLPGGTRMEMSQVRDRWRLAIIGCGITLILVQFHPEAAYIVIGSLEHDRYEYAQPGSLQRLLGDCSVIVRQGLVHLERYRGR